MSSYDPYAPPPVPAQSAPRTVLARSRSDKMVAGVCGGFAAYTGYDVNVIRIVLVAATVFGVGSPIILYLVAWLLTPESD